MKKLIEKIVKFVKTNMKASIWIFYCPEVEDTEI